MSADDLVFSALIASHPDPATASRALAMAEAAVLRRAADAINALPQDYECDPGWGDAAERLRRTAAGIEEKSGGRAAGVLVAEAYDGELAMLRGLVRTLRVVVRPDDADMAEVRRLLHHHASDDATARAQAGEAR
ncbi:hypothetical protein [Streptomyces sp. NPDC091215]|uniref:hypothetical protein n=1 Tax=Streptomyces sp. NPDC091215 TaxID=3155192 RepID=UPI0034375A71